VSKAGTYKKVEPAIHWGRVLTMAMRERGHNDVTLAAATGINRRTIGFWRHGGNFPRYHLALKAAEALMWDQLAVLAQEAHTKTCALEGCERTFIDTTRSGHKKFCTRGHGHAAERRQERSRRLVETENDSKLKTMAIKKYQSTIDAFCRSCGIDACPDSTCVIQVAGLSPLPVADERLRIA
jgi:hypothetical protein